MNHPASLLTLLLALVLTAALTGCGGSDSYEEDLSDADSSGLTADDDYSSFSEDEDFTNEYGDPSSICAHSGCTNKVASSGDTNCCPLHSNHCASCGCYIDEDALYCMSCLEEAAASAAGSSYDDDADYGDDYSYDYGSDYDDDYDYDQGYGYTAPEPGQSFSDYVKEQDPELYADMEEAWNSLE